jgi:hypothetical protein
MNNTIESIQPDSEKAKVLRYLEETVSYLNEVYGISDLTNIELFNIRKDIEQIVRGNPIMKIGEATIKQRITAAANTVSPRVEASHRFLLHYGINLNDMPWGSGLVLDRETLDYIREAVNRARQEDHQP